MTHSDSDGDSDSDYMHRQMCDQLVHCLRTQCPLHMAMCSMSSKMCNIVNSSVCSDD